MASAETVLYLFGGRTPWDSGTWISSDDRVRGGKSHSYLDCSSGSRAIFHGNLDIKTLGGAGFASQRTVDSASWNLAEYDGLCIKVGESDGKKYTLTLKNEVLPKRPDGREQSTISWEYDFICRNAELYIPWQDFKPTYRGKPKPDAEPLDLKNIRRISIMMRRKDRFGWKLNTLRQLLRSQVTCKANSFQVHNFPKHQRFLRRKWEIETGVQRGWTGYADFLHDSLSS